MPKLKPVGIEIFNDYSSPIQKCRTELTKQAWFGEDWWIYSHFNGGGFVFQLSKTNWFNHRGRGIHFEFWIDEAEYEAKEVPIVLHFEPETLNRKALGQQFKVGFEPYEEAFADYRINHKAICDKLQKQVKLSKSGLAKVVVAEFGRLQTLAPMIDDLIASLGS